MKDSAKGAKLYDSLMVFFDFLIIKKWRKRLWQKVEGGRVLEAGAGTGLNIPFYKPCCQVTALDSSRHFLEKAKRRAQEKGMEVEFIQGDVTAIPAGDKTFDYVVTTFLFCTVNDRPRAMKELKRVLRTGGLLLALEQIAPAAPMSSFINLAAMPLYRLFGANMAPDITKIAKEAGFGQICLYPVFLDTVNIIRCRK